MFYICTQHYSGDSSWLCTCRRLRHHDYLREAGHRVVTCCTSGVQGQQITSHLCPDTTQNLLQPVRWHQILPWLEPLRGCLAVSLPWLWHTRLPGLSSQADGGQHAVQAGLVQFSNGACVELPLGIPKAEAVDDCISGMVRERGMHACPSPWQGDVCAPSGIAAQQPALRRTAAVDHASQEVHPLRTAPAAVDHASQEVAPPQDSPCRVLAGHPLSCHLTGLCIRPRPSGPRSEPSSHLQARMNGGTCFAEAVRVAGQLLKSSVAPEGARSVVLLTDGRVDHYQGERQRQGSPWPQSACCMRRHQHAWHGRRWHSDGCAGLLQVVRQSTLLST